MKNYAYGIVLSSLVAIPVLAQDGPGKFFETLDANKDGIVSHAEVMVKAKADFAEYDKNRDGIIVLEELPKQMPLREGRERMMKKIKERRAEKAKKGDRRGMGRMSSEDMKEKMRPTRMKFMARMDDNGDERLDVDEFAKPMIRRFKYADVNGDGAVTFEEMKKSAKKRKHGKFRKSHENRRR